MSSFTKRLIWTFVSLRTYTLLCGLVAAQLAGSSVLGVWERWDAIYYARIASFGYSPEDGTTNFHPLFPWLAHFFTHIAAPVVALLLVSSLATIALYILFERLALLDLAPEQARRSTFMIIFWPISYILYLPYTESLWLACGVACLMFARQEKWWLSGLAGAAATLTRQQGLFLVAPLAWEIWAASKHEGKHIYTQWRKLLSVSLIPLAYLSWIVLRTVVLGDVKPNFDSLSGLIYSTLLSPATSRVVEEYSFTFPWKAAYLAVQRAWNLSYVNPWVDLFFGASFLPLIALAWRGMRTSYRVYVVLIALVSFSFHTGMLNTGGAYLALPRHLLLAFPVFIGLGARFRFTWNPLLITVSMAVMTFFIFGYFWVRLVP